MFARFALRDAAILLATALLWWWEMSRPADPADWISIAAGVGAAICAYNLHEWGHVLGALKTNSVFEPAKRLISPFLFSYDSQNNSRRQFLIMSLAGFVATGLFVLAYSVGMPQDRLAGRIAFKGALILASLTVIIEFPIFFRALLGKTLPRVEVFR